MKRFFSLTQLVLLAGMSLAYATGFITKATAEHDALRAVGGGTVVLAVLENTDNPPVWSVDIVKPQAEYEVKVNARTGAIVAVIVGG